MSLLSIVQANGSKINKTGGVGPQFYTALKAFLVHRGVTCVVALNDEQMIQLAHWLDGYAAALGIELNGSDANALLGAAPPPPPPPYDGDHT